MNYKNGERMRDIFGPFCFYCSLVFYILGAILIRSSLAIYPTKRPKKSRALME